MSFNGNEGDYITLEEGAAMTASYRSSVQPGTVTGQFVGKEKLIQILNQPNCVGIRMYYGLDEFNENSIVAVGVDSNENDITNGHIIDRFIKCPPRCSKRNPLNS
jgi:hypothetical protein